VLPLLRVPVVDLAERRGREPVDAPFPVGPHRDESGLAQDPQVLRHAGLAQGQELHEVAGRALAVAQAVEDQTSMGLGHGGECVHENILLFGNMKSSGPGSLTLTSGTLRPMTVTDERATAAPTERVLPKIVSVDDHVVEPA